MIVMWAGLARRSAGTEHVLGAARVAAEGNPGLLQYLLHLGRRILTHPALRHEIDRAPGIMVAALGMAAARRRSADRAGEELLDERDHVANARIACGGRASRRLLTSLIIELLIQRSAEHTSELQS